MITVLGCLLVSVGVVLPGPNGAYIAAAQDLESSVSKADWRYTRYLSFYALPQSEWSNLAAATSYWINSLSLRSAMHRAPVVGEGSLLRIDLRKLGWDCDARQDYVNLAKKLGVTLKVEADVWEQLVRRDPYFKVTTKVKKTYVDPYRRPYYRDEIIRGWLEPVTELRVRTATHSRMPVVRADWFLRETGFTSTGVRAPIQGLYDQFLLQPGTYADLEKLLGANRDLIGGLGLAYGGGVTRSGVSGFNRGIEVYPTQVGGTRKDIWRTYDVKTNLDVQSIKRQFVGVDGFSTIKFDGGEAIYQLPNGLHGFAIFNSGGKLIGDVPQEIAFRKGDPSAPDLTVYPWTCVACHTRGIIDFADEQSRLAVNRDPVGLIPLEVDKLGNPAIASLDDYKKRELKQLQRLGEEYYGLAENRLGTTIRADQSAYIEAIKRVNDLESAKNSSEFIRMFQQYQYSLVDLPGAAREMGVSEEEARGMFHRSNNADLLGLLAGVSCPRDAFERAFEAGMTSRSWPWEGH